MSLYDEGTSKHISGQLWNGRIASTITEPDELVYVTVQELGPIRLGPCMWPTKDALSLPQRGDFCLVGFDNDRRPWVLVWWPYG